LDLAFCFKAHVPQTCHAAAYTSINQLPFAAYWLAICGITGCPKKVIEHVSRRMHATGMGACLAAKLLSHIKPSAALPSICAMQEVI
jgi:hypothetical protein